MPARWFDQLQPLSPLHLVTVTICFAAIAASSRLGRTLRGTERERRFRLAWGWATLGFQVAMQAWYMSEEDFDWAYDLPLQLCDLAGITASLAMIFRRRWLETLLYFWGIGLSTQAFFTPVISEGVGAVKFWLFWLSHLAIVGSAVYDVAVLGYRPRGRDCALAILVTLAYVVMMTGFNAAFRFNYGYVGPIEPRGATIVQRLGPWPWRVPVMAALGTAAFVLLWAVWPVSEAVWESARRRRSP